MSHQIRSAYGPKSTGHQTDCGGESLTKQSFKESCDINNILAKYQKTGVIDHYNKFGAKYGDCPAITFTESEQIIASAKSMFEELPSKARRHFENDPAKFLEFCETVEGDAGAQVLLDLGLLAPGSTIGSKDTENSVSDTTEPPEVAKTDEKTSEKTPDQ